MIASVTAKIQTKHLPSTNQMVTTVPSYSPHKTGFVHSHHYENLESHITIFNLLSFQKIKKETYVTTTMLCVSVGTPHFNYRKSEPVCTKLCINNMTIQKPPQDHTFQFPIWCMNKLVTAMTLIILRKYME
jgi:hypothetical protein